MFCVGRAGKCQNWVSKALANSNRRAADEELNRVSDGIVYGATYQRPTGALAS